MTVTALAPGVLFAKDFEVVRPLSSGGMGAVYVVLQKSTGKQRALKLMLPQLVADAALRQRFEREARVGALIESDHVIEVVAAGVDEPTGMPWLAMELLKGQDLGAVVATQGPLPLAAVRTILQQLCHAVGAAHAAGIVHRDLKPENVFIADSKRAGDKYLIKVLDFGIARIAAEAATQHTGAMGSPAWMAPEQTERAAITPAADVWAIGLIAFHLLTGRMFWPSADAPDASVAQIMREVILGPIPRASERAREYGVPSLLPPWFDVWFGRCVDRDPARRFPHAGEAWSAFERCAAGAPLSAVAPTMMDPPLGATVPADPFYRRTEMGAPAPVRTELGAPPMVPGSFGAAPPAGVPPPFGATPAPVDVSVPVTPRRGGVAIAAVMGGLVAVSVAAGTAFVLLRGGGGGGDEPKQAPPVPVVVEPTSTAAPETPPPTEPSSTPLTTTPLAPTTAIAARTDPPTKKAGDAPAKPFGDMKIGDVATKAADPKPPDKPTGGSAPFDRGAASATISAATATLRSCKTADGPTGPGHVTITFAPSGEVSAAVVDAGPYPGTPTGGCIAGKYRACKVPPFEGAPVRVGKSFSLD